MTNTRLYKTKMT